MKLNLILCITLLASGVFISTFADVNPADASIPKTGDHSHRNRRYGFEFDLPEGWAVDESVFYVAHYSRVFLVVNSQRPSLKIREWPVSKNTIEFSDKTTFQQMQPGEVYVFFSNPGGPTAETMSTDSVGANLHSLLATNRIAASSEIG